MQNHSGKCCFEFLLLVVRVASQLSLFADEFRFFCIEIRCIKSSFTEFLFFERGEVDIFSKKERQFCRFRLCDPMLSEASR